MTFIGFEIELVFEYPDVDENRLANLYNGKVVKIMNEKRRTVKIP